MSDLRHLVRTGPVRYAWNTATGSTIDVKAIDPAKKASDQSNGRPCIGVEVGVTGDLVCVVNGANVFFKARPVATFLPVRASSFLSSGSVYDAAVALTAVTTTFAGGGGPANAAAVVTAINTAVNGAVASIPAAGPGAVASLDASSKFLVLTAPAGAGSLKITGGTGLAQLFGAGLATPFGAPINTTLPNITSITGTVDLTVAGNLTALAGLTVLLAAAPIFTCTSTAADLVIYWEI